MKVIIDSREFNASAGESVLKVALDKGIEIPHLCYDRRLEPQHACGLCTVEVMMGSCPGVRRACAVAVEEGMEVRTDTPDAVEARRISMRYLAGRAPRSESIRQMARAMGVEVPVDGIDSAADGQGQTQCVLCGLCVAACRKVGACALAITGTGRNRAIGVIGVDSAAPCLECGLCERVCPTGAIRQIRCDALASLGAEGSIEQ